MEEQTPEDLEHVKYRNEFVKKTTAKSKSIGQRSRDVVELSEQIRDQINALHTVIQSSEVETTREFYNGEIRALEWVLILLNDQA